MIEYNEYNTLEGERILTVNDQKEGCFKNILIFEITIEIYLFVKEMLMIEYTKLVI